MHGIASRKSNNLEEIDYKYLVFVLTGKDIAVYSRKMKKGINCLD